ncbi:hypothetical protein PHAMO_170085 [Magnetospirillum molischianum DSM 120]|uniref:Uncharacterized protein n=1 Tax=Magnetospirillum molischianum DSM 120 TaxID=1150626 RepID=H8FNT8_MAGML|nr:hypothetical protein PHAMO_170085 [Magnetospirillum molischianum DSM 120]
MSIDSPLSFFSSSSGDRGKVNEPMKAIGVTFEATRFKGSLAHGVRIAYSFSHHDEFSR